MKNFICIYKNHLYNVIKLEYKQHGISWCRKQAAEDDPVVPTKAKFHMRPPPFFFYLSESCMINPDLLGLKCCGLLKGKKKKRKQARKRRKKRGREEAEGGGDREVAGRKGENKRGKGERKYYAESFQILVSGPSVKNVRLKWKATYLTHHGSSTSLAAAYKIIVGYSLIMPSLIFHSQK